MSTRDGYENQFDFKYFGDGSSENPVHTLMIFTHQYAAHKVKDFILYKKMFGYSEYHQTLVGPDDFRDDCLMRLHTEISLGNQIITLLRIENAMEMKTILFDQTLSHMFDYAKLYGLNVIAKDDNIKRLICANSNDTFKFN